jgi:hypothetical protein
VGLSTKDGVTMLVHPRCHLLYAEITVTFHAPSGCDNLDAK